MERLATIGLVTYRCGDEGCGRVRQFTVSVFCLQYSTPDVLGARAVAGDGWISLGGKLFCRSCSWGIEDSLDRRPFGPDADLIRGALDYRAAVAKMEVTTA